MTLVWSGLVQIDIMDLDSRRCCIIPVFVCMHFLFGTAYPQTWEGLQIELDSIKCTYLETCRERTTQRSQETEHTENHQIFKMWK